MTICLAAVCKFKPGTEEEAIVFCTDHMLTIGSENDELGEFEQSIEKFKRISEDRVSLLSGDPLLADSIYRNVNFLQKSKIHLQAAS